MKAKLTLLAAGLLTWAACDKNTPLPTDSVMPVELHVCLSGNERTKSLFDAASVQGEENVQSVQILVFNDGAIDGYGNQFETFTDGNFKDQRGVRLTATQGERRIYAAVNVAQDLSQIATETQLLSTLSHLQDNAIGRFEMLGSLDRILTAREYITVPVDRFVSRIKIDKITNRFSNATLGEQVYLRRIYLTHFTAGSDYRFASNGEAYATTGFGSQLDRDGSTLTTSEALLLNPFVYEKIFSGSASSETPGAEEGCPKINHNSSYTNAHVFYTYPNGDLEALPTHLVIEAVVAGKIYTYPLRLDSTARSTLEANKSYEISELVLTRVGNPSNGDDKIDEGEDRPIEPSDADFTVRVKEWDVLLLGDNGNVKI